tara:strand:+ start:594 stop:914 length:321 start_codon:yes stop_codon:yes gene_type:complete
MAVENKAKEDMFNTNYSFLKKWHNENYTLLPKGSKNKDTSMQLGTREFDGITYILPTYKKGEGKISATTFLDDIKKRKIVGYNSKEVAELELVKLRNEILGKKNGN